MTVNDYVSMIDTAELVPGDLLSLDNNELVFVDVAIEQKPFLMLIFIGSDIELELLHFIRTWSDRTTLEHYALKVPRKCLLRGWKVMSRTDDAQG